MSLLPLQPPHCTPPCSRLCSSSHPCCRRRRPWRVPQLEWRVRWTGIKGTENSGLVLTIKNLIADFGALVLRGGSVIC